MRSNISLLLILLLPCVSFGAIINAPGNQSTIQAGINVATDFDTVLVIVIGVGILHDGPLTSP